jgi:hypothetical protein
MDYTMNHNPPRMSNNKNEIRNWHKLHKNINTSCDKYFKAYAY